MGGLHVSATSVVSKENVLQCVTAYVVVTQLGSSKKSWSNPAWLSQCMFQHSWDNTHLPMGIYPSCNGPRIVRVKGYMEMHFTCNLVDVQMMHRIYTMIDIQMLIITYMLIIVYHDITVPALWYSSYCTYTLPPIHHHHPPPPLHLHHIFFLITTISEWALQWTEHFWPPSSSSLAPFSLLRWHVCHG